MKLNPGNHTQVLHQLAAEVSGLTQFNAPLAEHNSWQIGGPADLLIEPEGPQQVAKVVRFTPAGLASQLEALDANANLPNSAGSHRLRLESSYPRLHPVVTESFVPQRTRLRDATEFHHACAHLAKTPTCSRRGLYADSDQLHVR